jgi:hypothetical protein
VIRSEDTASESGKLVNFHFLKSNFFRVIHADGVWGGLSPNLNIHMSFYSERNPIPQMVAMVLSDVGTPARELPDKRVIKEGYVREIEADVVLDLQVAASLARWLTEKVEQGMKIVNSMNNLNQEAQQNDDSTETGANLQ